MKNEQSKRLFRAILCVIIAIFGLIFTFGSGNGEETEMREKNTGKEKNHYEYRQEELPTYENESENEIYTEGRELNVYFTNTEKLDNSSLPLAVHAVLCQEAQKYLDANGFENISEIRILEDGFKDGENSVTFQCSLPGYEEILVVSYQKERNALKFETMISERIN